MAPQPKRPAQDSELARAHRLYEEYAKPLEAEHEGEYVAVSKDGKTVIAPTLLEAVDRAVEALGPGNFVFKIGEEAVGKWLQTRVA